MKTFNEFSKKAKKQKWMKQMSGKVGKLGGHEGKIDWDTATHLYNQGKSPDDVAKVIVKNQT